MSNPMRCPLCGDNGEGAGVAFAALRLTKVDFDNMENRSANAICLEELGTFVGESQSAAAAKVERFLATIRPSTKTYEAWDKQIYPKFVTTKVTLR